MVDVLAGNKATLGKLLASENIRVEHRQISGPCFDVRERVLALPMWKNVDGDLYDLMIGHEVGHALFTPTEGWAAKIQEHGNDYKMYLNLVEDVRIERMMKDKYPGLRKPMYNGYTELVERGFFGGPLSDMKALPFADRVNVYFKLGVRSMVTFTDTEQNLVDRIGTATTWDEVDELAYELYRMSKAEKKDMEETFTAMMKTLQDIQDAIDNGNIEQAEGTDQLENTVQDMIQELREAGKEEMADKLEAMSQKMRQKIAEWMESDTPYSITENTMKEQEETLIDTSAYPPLYVTWPKLRLEDWVIPAKVTHKLMEFHPDLMAKREEIYAEFMSGNRAYINYLVKEFELRRNAKQFAKARVSKTGDLDMDKIWKYRLSEDLFMQSTIVPNGKNHGMLMIVDMSGSMTSNMSGTLEQIVSMAAFCRKVNIPFDVYGFIDNEFARPEFLEAGIDFDTVIVNRATTARYIDPTSTALSVDINHFRMKQLVHSTMRTVEFNDAIKNLLLLAHTFSVASRPYTYSSEAGYAAIPRTMRLGGTPLNEAIMVLRYIAEKFKKDTKIEILNTIILTDGDASYTLGTPDREGFNYNIILSDPHSSTSVSIGSKYSRGTMEYLEMYKNITGSRVVGFYLMSGRSFRSEILDRYSEAQIPRGLDRFDAFEKQYKNEFLKHRYFGLKTKGYDIYFMVPGNDLEIDNITMDTVLGAKKDAPAAKSTLLKAFKKMQTSKSISRVFLNQFIQQVS